MLKETVNLVLMRHGESLWNKQKIFTGSTEVPLTDKGQRQAIDAGKELKQLGIVFNHVFTSMLERALETTTLALHESQPELIKDIKQTPLLNERNYGILTGNKKDDMRAQYGIEQIQKWRRDYNARPPEGESLYDVVQRVRPFYEKTLKPLLKKDQKAFVSAHHHTIRALLIVMNIYTPEDLPKIEIDNAKPLYLTTKPPRLL